jgi:CubicO group peptidase (beta-lactamase class C family)
MDPNRGLRAMIPMDRRAFVMLTGAAVMSTPAASDNNSLADQIDAGMRLGRLRDVHAVIVERGSQVLLERYYAGSDEVWGQPLGVVKFTSDTLHDLRSVTKSIVGLLYGIALDRGLVPPVDAQLLAQFPQYPDLASDSQRAQLTVLNALNMTLGMEWDEQRPYTDPANSEIAMERAPDRYRFVLERPFVTTPGTRWIYSGGAVALVGAIIAKGAKATLPDFARQALFTPLGIATFGWAAGKDSVPSAASGMRMRPRDLLRIGQMVLAGGVWNGQQIVSRAWLDASFSPVVDTTWGLKYGRLWYIGEDGVFPGKHRWLAAIGNGGQRLFLMPDAELATVVLCGAYNRPDQSQAPNHIWRNIVLANLLG